jgi:hypothetical protein
MSLPFDATLKELVSQTPADLRVPFGLPDLEPAQTLNVDLSTISAATDVAIGFGDPVQEIADINFQSGPDPNVAARLHLYNAAFHMRYRVPVRSVLVLLRPKASTVGLNGKLVYTCGGRRVSFGYDVIRLWKQPVQPFLEGGVGLLPLAPLCRLASDKPVDQAIREVVGEIDHRLCELTDQARAVRLMTATFILTGMRVRKESLSGVFEGARVMHKTTAWDQAVDEGMLKGELRLLLTIGRRHLGEPDEETQAALGKIKDPDRLNRMGEAILSNKTWEALLNIE